MCYASVDADDVEPNAMNAELWIDESHAEKELILQELSLLEDSVEGLVIDRLDEESASRLYGRLREFAPLAKLNHESGEVLEIVCEELMTQFGWTIDIRCFSF